MHWYTHTHKYMHSWLIFLVVGPNLRVRILYYCTLRCWHVPDITVFGASWLWISWLQKLCKKMEQNGLHFHITIFICSGTCWLRWELCTSNPMSCLERIFLKTWWKCAVVFSTLCEDSFCETTFCSAPRMSFQM